MSMDSTGEKDVIYLDYNATTNIHEEILKEMELYLNIFRKSFKFT